MVVVVGSDGDDGVVVGVDHVGFGFIIGSVSVLYVTMPFSNSLKLLAPFFVLFVCLFVFLIFLLLFYISFISNIKV